MAAENGGKWQKPGDPLRIIVMGQQAFGKDVLARLLDEGKDQVVAVYCEPDREGKPVDPIKEFALEKGLPVHQPANFDDQAALDTLASCDADLMVMAFVNVFVPEAARDTPKFGSICFHPSLLPLHRGPSAVNWPIIMGATRSGYSWFYPSDGLDEGDSLMQWECEIAPDDTVINLYFKKIYPSAVDSVIGVCDLFRSGKPPRIVPDEAAATYERRCTKKHAKIDWNKPVKQVYDLIRGTNPSPGAWTTLNGEEVQIFDCARKPGDGVSSKVVSVSEEGITVQLIGGRIKIMRVRPAGGDKMSAHDWASAAGIAPGTVLGT
jgi:methionyl-tRNA formyltransferase